MEQRPYLQIVDQNYKRPHARQFVPDPVVKTSRPKLCCLPGGASVPWQSLSERQRRVRMQVMYNRETDEFTAAAFHGQELIELWTRKPNARKEITMWFDRSSKELLRANRVPWSKIKDGNLWESEIVLCDFYFQAREERKQIERVRAENARLMINKMLSGA